MIYKCVLQGETDGKRLALYTLNSNIAMSRG